ncbi:DUF1501 domain-containing protein [Tuwongella immobilis]|uniref:Sulfatase n=1 Tax=Tuwongella immobilis TaxID=692036 RepID=A0A6C2YPM8_9BACT|nr:DUF1501 domain-containing protein [Tuwongella immobilis]VIP03416.1 secreted protein containing duf1501 : Uncharacterized protein OS=Chthoniobacter flavus Ellin428 GN=CfE428DRAFT_2450 PE=4 SV=1: DUF1501 [Tuwongella immobilis]VTS04204.1 secreted protein containing duf1501 : Uncharacterized protein OS=Chthoniobacter flavus Ellin428 GN=CfE428DRAFT_2450 PE=4 SV=1: DUF1501 [Tuwongella immobilis]
MQHSMNPSLSRRDVLRSVGCGFGYLALTDLLAAQAIAKANNSGLHHPAKAKRVLFIFMQGGPSHVDSFDHKPRLQSDDGKMMSFDDARVKAKTGKVVEHRVMKPLWKFRPYGQTGKMVSDLFPQIATHVDDLCFLHGMHTEGVAHGPATLFLHTGSINLVRPSVGSWVTYGLGSENQDLPGFVTILPSMGNGGPRNFSNAFLPTKFQGTAIGRAGVPAKDANIRNITNQTQSVDAQQRQLELLNRINREQFRMNSNDTELEAVIGSYELAYRMQTKAPEILDLAKESQATQKLYGIGAQPTDSFGRQCLMARRLLESGVRYVQVTYGDNSDNPAWDQHSNLPKHADHAKAVDQPVSGLLTDLKARGLLEDTLVWFGGEFGRTPYAEKNGTGRDHNPGGFTMWLAGGGVKPGFSFGQTDEFGHHAVQDKVHMHDMHATLLHLLGVDHTRLTFRFAGRDFRLTDVAGHVVHEIIRS